MLITVMGIFAALGLADKIIGGKFGLAACFDQGLAAMGTLALSMVGFYTMGMTFVRSQAAVLGKISEWLPFDSSLPICCLFASDMGALNIAQEMAATPELAVFTGGMIAAGLGATISYQLPVYLSSVQEKDISDLMQGFVFGIISVPIGLAVGGWMLGIPWSVCCINMAPILFLCAVLILASLFLPKQTIKVLTVIGHAIRILGCVLFGISVVGLFVPQFDIVDPALIQEVLYIILRMAIVTCGGLVMSQFVLKYLGRFIRRIGTFLGVNSESVIGIVLSLTQGLAMLPFFSKMDRKGKLMNGAFSVCGVNLLGGQLAYVSALIPSEQVPAFLTNKIVAGICGMALAALYCNYMKSRETAKKSGQKEQLNAEV